MKKSKKRSNIDIYIESILIVLLWLLFRFTYLGFAPTIVFLILAIPIIQVITDIVLIIKDRELGLIRWFAFIVYLLITSMMALIFLFAPRVT